MKMYLEEKMTNIKHLHIFSDGCGAQNKNHTFIRLCSALVSLGKFETIDQYYPVRGHSFLPCDRDFGLIKRKIRKCDRTYTLQEYADLMLKSSKKDQVKVRIVDASSFIDFKSWWPKHYKRMMLAMESVGSTVAKADKVSLKISKFMQFSHSKSKDKLVVAREYINGLKFFTFRLNNSKKLPLVLPENLVYPSGKVPININKISDLKKLINYIPQDNEIKSFYDQILNWPTCTNENVEDCTEAE